MKGMKIMGDIQVFRKAEIHKHRVSLCVLFDVPVMPESAWSNQLFPDQVSRCLVTAIYLWQLSLKKYWIMVNGRKKKWLKQLIII